jgi:predicted MPP superfamily phosphohydrolase
MKIFPFILIFISVIAMLHIYICIRTYQSLEYIPALRIPAVVIIILLITIFILTQTGLLLHIFGFNIAGTFSFFASSWIFILLGIFISILLIDIVRVLNYFIDFYPLILKTNYILFKFILMSLTISTTIIWYIMGYLNFITPQKTELDIFINKPQITENIKKENSLKIVVVSDVHIGYIINKKKLRQYVDTINTQDADIVFIVGDLCDNVIEPLIDQKIYEELMDIKSRLGVYMVTGNHEHYGGNKDAKISYFKKCGLIVLEDSVALIDNRFYVAGRKDRTDKNRITTNDLLQGLDTSKPIILLDHQPYNLDASVSAGVDLHLSGHTHDGQFFPITLITKAIYEVSAGYKLKGNTHIYVTSGLGLWGPPIRLGTKSEFVIINMKW